MTFRTAGRLLGEITLGALVFAIVTSPTEAGASSASEDASQLALADSNWEPIGTFQFYNGSRVGVATSGPGNLYALATNPTAPNGLLLNTLANGLWSGWQVVQNSTNSRVFSAVSYAPGRLDVVGFTNGRADQKTSVVYASYENGNWSNWQEFEDPELSFGFPTITAWKGSSPILWVYATDRLGVAWEKSSGDRGATWTSWVHFDGSNTPVHSVHAVSSEPGRIELVAGAGDGSGNVLFKSYSAGQWTAWQSLGGPARGIGGISSSNPGRLDVFIQGTDGGIYRKFFQGIWSGWDPISSTPYTRIDHPTPVAWGPGRVDLIGTAITPRTEIVHKFIQL